MSITREGKQGSYDSMPVALIIDDTCKARAEELGVAPDAYRMWEAGWKVPAVDEAIKREMLVKASAEANKP